MGLDLPGEVKDDLARVVRALEGSVAGARWVPRDNVHVTLSFLGSVADEQVPGIVDAVQGAAASVSAGRAEIGGLGAFPSVRRARVVWAGLGDHDGVVAALAEAVMRALEGIGFPREQRAFHPHVTLARLKTSASVALDQSLAPSGTVPVERVTVFQSHLGRPAPRYEARAVLPLGGA